MARERCAPANEIAPPQLVERIHERGSRDDPRVTFRDDVGTGAVASDDERVAPFARAADVELRRARALADFAFKTLHMIVLLSAHARRPRHAAGPLCATAQSRFGRDQMSE